MNRPLSIILSSAVFTSVIAGAITFSTLKLMQPKGATSTAAAPAKEVVSRSSKASPAMVGTDHPVPVTPPLQLAASPKPKAFNPKPFNPPATPVPQASAVVENASRHQAESPSDNTSRHPAESLADNSYSREPESPAELVRERAEEARESAERLRARVEDLYQAHRISETAYKQGQAEYQHALAKYEDQIAKLRGTTTATGATND
jgi:type IV secretory pathway VirB10-like protein